MRPARATAASAGIVAALVLVAVALHGEKGPAKPEHAEHEAIAPPAGTALPESSAAEPRALEAETAAVPAAPLPGAIATAPDAACAEALLLAQLRSLVEDDPPRAYALAKEGLSLFPDSAHAPEMAALAVKSLARQGKRSEARGEAETMVNRYPDSPWAREVERHTGAHPHRDQTAP